jgi:hypothetical protein
MHYLCGGGGDPKLEIVAEDARDHRIYYAQ